MSTAQAIAYEAVIGLEVHAQLLTRSKMFCACRADYQDAPPNTRVCPVCLGMPGVLPVINRQAIEFCIMTGLALNCTIARQTKFDRKNYPYPDLMKGYQISQYDNPIARKGWLEIEVDGQRRRIGITRVHQEEDVAKLTHVRDGAGSTYSLVDVNRAGVPLMEIVGEPDLRTPEEARQYLIALRGILQYLGVSTGNMEEGSFRCDANVSVRPAGATELPKAKVEVKNMNSFRAVYLALQYEVERQVKAAREGERIVQETRGWLDDKGVTVSQRTKEYAHDYRYFPEPDLPPLTIDPAWVEEIRARLPELPNARRDRFVAQYGLPDYDARLLTTSRAMADFFEQAVSAQKLTGEALKARAKAASNWLLGDVSRLLNAAGLEIERSKLTPQHLAELLNLVESRTLSTTLAKTVLEESFASGAMPGRVVAERGYTQITDASVVERAVAEAIASSPQAVQDYMKGKDTAMRFIVGQVMRISKGKANPGIVNELVKRELERRRGAGPSGKS
jgi:aspartyl-tRNA(Asn)/glutamyl-tRNA(Gln) amidotransferase subunit B